MNMNLEIGRMWNARITVCAHCIGYGILLAVVVFQTVALIETSNNRRELERLRAELKIWGACQRIYSGMSAKEALYILGDPGSAIKVPPGQIHLLYHISPEWLPDDGYHISGCRVIRKRPPEHPLVSDRTAR
jgi:hypothetical protein